VWCIFVQIVRHLRDLCTLGKLLSCLMYSLRRSECEYAFTIEIASHSTKPRPCPFLSLSAQVDTFILRKATSKLKVGYPELS
jgi:hypothetical protein